MDRKTILFPTDFSHTGDAALTLATSLARDMKARLLIVHVEEPPMVYAGEMYYGTAEPSREQLTKMLSEVLPNDPNIPCEHRVVTGDPAGALIQTALDEKAALIVMGTHGRTGLTRLLIGSVAEAVVRGAPCPVLTCKQPEGAPVSSS